MNMYYNKYLKYKNKYIELKNLYGGAKKISSIEEAGKKKDFTPIKETDFINFINAIKRGLTDITKITFFKCYNTLKLTSNLVNIIDPISDLYPLQIYINNNKIKDYSIIEFLFPTDLSLFEHLDKDGNTIFHKLIIQGDINTLEDIYFDDKINEEKRDVIKRLKDKNNLTIFKLAKSLNNLSESLKEQLLKGIHSIYDPEFEEQKLLWLSRKSKTNINDISTNFASSSLIASKPISTTKVSTLDSTSEIATTSETKKKLKIWEDVSKNEKKLEEVQLTGKGSEEQTTTKKKKSYTLEYLNKDMIQSYIDNDQITIIDTLYTTPLEFGETLETKIPSEWNVKNIRFVNKEKLGSRKVGFRDFIVQLPYKLLED